MRSRALSRAVATMVSAVVLVVGLMVGPANAFSASNNLTSGGVTYSVKAKSCWFYSSIVRTGCAYSGSMSISKSKSFTHRVDVKANGLNAKVTISASPSVTISGNKTTLATASKSGTGRSHAISGTAKPGLSVSVAARSRVASGSVSLNTGWTTW